MKKLHFLIALLVGSASLAVAQNCPASKVKGVHVVQKGENLYRISKKYGVAVSDLCNWNGISENETLPLCAELLVARPRSASSSPSSSVGKSNRSAAAPHSEEYTYDASPESGLIKQKQAEKKAELAEKAQNQTETAQKPAEYTTPSEPKSENDNWYDEDVYIVKAGETVEEIAARFGYTAWRFREINSLGPTETVKTGKILVNSECVCPARFRRGNQNKLPHDPTKTTTEVEKSARPMESERENTRQNWNEKPTGSPQKEEVVEAESIRSTTRKKPTEAEAAAEKAAEKANAAKPSTRTDANYMSIQERTMVDEINLMRSNPTGYIQYVEAYIADQKANGEMGTSISTARELISELRNTPPLSILQPSECVFNAAKKHGLAQKKTGHIEHQGTDGLWPWDRILNACPGFEDGNENLVGGYADVRKSVMLLLVDDGLEGRGHRKTLLEPKWKYVACYEIGPVGQFKDYWVQNFGN